MPTDWPRLLVALPWIRLGETRTPPLAIVLTAAAICRPFTDTLWPKAMRSWIIPFQAALDGSRPAVSPVTPMSVRWPRPKRVR